VRGKCLEPCINQRVARQARGPFSGKLERAQVSATFQPDPAQDTVQVAEGGVRRGLQVQPVTRGVAALDDQVEPAWGGLATLGGGMCCPASLEVIGHLPFAECPAAEAARTRDRLFAHVGIIYSLTCVMASHFRRIGRMESRLVSDKAHRARRAGRREVSGEKTPSETKNAQNPPAGRWSALHLSP